MRKKLFLFFFVILVFPLFVCAKDDERIVLYFFHGDGCPHCAAEEEYLETIREKYPNLVIEEYEVWYHPKNASLLSKIQKTLHLRSGVPTTIIGKKAIVGFSDEGSTNKKIEKAIEYYQTEEYIDVVLQIKNGTYQDKSDKESQEDKDDKEDKEDKDSFTIKVPFFKKIDLKKASLFTSAIVIGFIDGFNPCAMWVLLFLISVLIGMKNRKRMWSLGLAFLFTSAFVYFLIMLSWIQIAVQVTTVIWIRNAIALISLIGGIIQLRSFFRHSESGCEVVDDKKRKNIFKKIRKFTSEKSFLLALVGVIGLAVSVNIVELACSAGLPLVFTELLALNKVSELAKIGYVLLYILFFLIDDLIVFFIAMISMKVTGITTKYNQYSHLLGGIIMIAIGILLIFKPGWLMFQFK